jgi:mRNA interferase MazF
MARVLRGDVIWADLDPVKGSEQGGRRPVVVVSEDVFNARSGTAIVMAITSQPQKAGYPLVSGLSSVKLPKPSWVKISQIRTVIVQRLGRKIGQASPEEVDQFIDALNEILGR